MQQIRIKSTQKTDYIKITIHWNWADSHCIQQIWNDSTQRHPNFHLHLHTLSSSHHLRTWAAHPLHYVSANRNTREPSWAGNSRVYPLLRPASATQGGQASDLGRRTRVVNGAGRTYRSWDSKAVRKQAMADP
uniref:Uncharacterized protein n=1 Tax=Opuntia streptacantha TaxID=393608 RepID=A0A7C9AQ39_OPUST